MSRRDWDDNFDDDYFTRDDSLKGVVAPTLHRTIGPPGCGKTYWLTRQAAHAARKYGKGGVVISSLTRAAAVEVASRSDLPPRNVGTLHSHAYHALNRPAIVETTQGLKEWNEYCGSQRMRVSTMHAVDPENAEAEPTGADNEGSELLSQMNILRQRTIDPKLWPPKVQRFHRKWQQFKAETNRMDFTDLIETAYTDTERHPAKPDVFMIDEAQDMSIIEMRLARKWGDAASQLVVVGDPDQNLYQWRGSDPEAFYMGQADTYRVLAQSYRVPAAVHRFAVGWIEQMPDRPPVEYHPRRIDPTDPDSPVAEGELAYSGAYWADPRTMLREIQAQLDVEVSEIRNDGTYTERPATVMVLASCGYMLKPLIAELRARGIPFHNPYRINHGAWNALRGARRLQASLAPLPPDEGGTNTMWTWGDLRAWTEPLQARGVLTRGAKTIIEAKCAEDRFGDSDTNTPISIAKLARLIEPQHLEAVINVDTAWWEKHLLHTHHERQRYALNILRKQGPQHIADTPRLILGTIHSVKGGQADTVLLCPDLSPTAYFDAWKKRNNGHDAILRQMYVGATRARHKLVLCRNASQEAVTWKT